MSTPFDDERFALAWPATTRNIHGHLRRMGCSAEDRDDIAQEVALRLFSRRIPFSDGADLSRYAVKSARNSYISLLRQRRTTFDITVAERQPSLVHVATTVENRLTLEAAYREMRTFTPAELALLDEPEEEQTKDSATTGTQKGRRHRLRNRIRKAIGGFLVCGALATVLTQSPTTPQQAERGAFPRWGLNGQPQLAPTYARSRNAPA